MANQVIDVAFETLLKLKVRLRRRRFHSVPDCRGHLFET